MSIAANITANIASQSLVSGLAAFVPSIGVEAGIYAASYHTSADEKVDVCAILPAEDGAFSKNTFVNFVDEEISMDVSDSDATHEEDLAPAAVQTSKSTYVTPSEVEGNAAIESHAKVSGRSQAISSDVAVRGEGVPIARGIVFDLDPIEISFDTSEKYLTEVSTSDPESATVAPEFAIRAPVTSKPIAINIDFSAPGTEAIMAVMGGAVFEPTIVTADQAIVDSQIDFVSNDALGNGTNASTAYRPSQNAQSSDLVSGASAIEAPEWTDAESFSPSRTTTNSTSIVDIFIPGINAKSIANAVSAFRLSTARVPNGLSRMTLSTPSRNGGESTRIHFSRTAGGVEFVGIEGGKTMGASHPASINLPIPTFTPSGTMHDGMVQPGYGVPGHRSNTDDETGRDLEDLLTSLVFEQLRRGPARASAVNILRQIRNYLDNNALIESGHTFTPKTWTRLVKRSLGLLARSVPLFDDIGLRSPTAIRHDAAAIAGMDVATLYAWENSFEIDVLSDELFAESRVPIANPIERMLFEHLELGLRRRIPAMAESTIDPDLVDPSIGIAGEANLQWGIATISAMEGIDLKVRAAVEFLSSVHKKNWKAACKGIALIVRHSSVVGGILAEEPLVDRWTEAEVRALISKLMTSEMWETMGQRSLRKHFDGEPHVNAFLNEVIFNANYAGALNDLSRIDVQTVTEEEFWSAVEDTGVEDIIFNNVLARMAQHN